MKKTKVDKYIEQFLSVSGLDGNEVARVAAITGAIIGINTVFDLKADKKKIVAELNWLEDQLRLQMAKDASIQQQNGAMH